MIYYISASFDGNFSGLNYDKYCIVSELLGLTLNFPKDATIYCIDGVLKNCTLVGNNTKIIAKNYQIFDNCILSGTWRNDEIYPEWFGAKTNDSSVNCSTSIQSCLDNIGIIGTKVQLSNGTYHCAARLNVNRNDTYLIGSGNNCILQFANTDGILVTKNTSVIYRITIKDVFIKKPESSKCNALEFQAAYYVAIENVYINGWKNGVIIKGMAYGNCAYFNINNTRWYANYYAVRFVLDLAAKAKSLNFGAAQINISNSHLAQCHKTAIYQSLLNDDWVEGMPIADKYIGDHYNELLISNCGFEGNGFEINIGCTVMMSIRNCHFESPVSINYPLPTEAENKKFAKILIGHSVRAFNVEFINNGAGYFWNENKLDYYMSFSPENDPEDHYKVLSNGEYIDSVGVGIQKGEIKMIRFVGCDNYCIRSVNTSQFTLKYNGVQDATIDKICNGLGTITT